MAKIFLHKKLVSLVNLLKNKQKLLNPQKYYVSN